MSETRSVETSAADIEEAIELGLSKLGVSRESVIVEILDEPSRGLLGIGARPARVRLTTAAPVRPATPPPPPQRAERPGAYDVDEEDEDHVPLLSQAVRVEDEELDDDARVGLATVKELLGACISKRRWMSTALPLRVAISRPGCFRFTGVTWVR